MANSIQQDSPYESAPVIGRTVPATKAIDYFSIPRIRRNVLIICGLLLINKLGTPGNLLCYAILLVWAVRTPEGAVKAISISGFLIMASPFIVTRGGLVGPLKYVLLLVAGLTILRFSRNPFGQPFLVALFLFGLVAALLSIYNDYFVTVSLLKVASFTFGAFCLLNVSQLRRNVTSEMVEWGFSLVAATVLLSFGALLVGAGYGSYETIWGGRFSGYRGVFGHPQVLGVMAGMFSVYLTSLLLFVEFPHRKFAVILLLGLLVLLYLSEARTGLYGYVLAMAITLFLVNLGNSPINEKKLLRRYQKQFAGVAFAGLILLVVFEGLSGAVSERAVQFVQKGEQAGELSPAVMLRSREEQRSNAFESFKKKPWTGIGFGTDLSTVWQRKATLLSAPTEKGFLPTAILEEVGIIGTSFFLLFVLSLYIYLLRSRRFLALAVFSGFLMFNMGEMVFFAFGGLGMLCWALIGMAISGANAHIVNLKIGSR